LLVQTVIAISEFRAKCYAILEQVRKTRQPIRVTRFGKPLAQIVPQCDWVAWWVRFKFSATSSDQSAA